MKPIFIFLLLFISYCSIGQPHIESIVTTDEEKTQYIKTLGYDEQNIYVLNQVVVINRPDLGFVITARDRKTLKIKKSVDFRKDFEKPYNKYIPWKFWMTNNKIFFLTLDHKKNRIVLVEINPKSLTVSSEQTLLNGGKDYISIPTNKFLREKTINTLYFEQSENKEWSSIFIPVINKKDECKAFVALMDNNGKIVYKKFVAIESKETISFKEFRPTHNPAFVNNDGEVTLTFLDFTACEDHKDQPRVEDVKNFRFLMASYGIDGEPISNKKIRFTNLKLDTDSSLNFGSIKVCSFGHTIYWIASISTVPGIFTLKTDIHNNDEGLIVFNKYSHDLNRKLEASNIEQYQDSTLKLEFHIRDREGGIGSLVITNTFISSNNELICLGFLFKSDYIEGFGFTKYRNTIVYKFDSDAHLTSADVIWYSKNFRNSPFDIEYTPTALELDNQYLLFLQMPYEDISSLSLDNYNKNTKSRFTIVGMDKDGNNLKIYPFDFKNKEEDVFWYLNINEAVALDDNSYFIKCAVVTAKINSLNLPYYLSASAYTILKID